MPDTTNKLDDTIKVDLISCNFFISSPGLQDKSFTINSQNDDDMAFLFRHNEFEISICLNGTKDEVSIPVDQLLSFKVINSNNFNENHKAKSKNKNNNNTYNILLKFKQNFKRTVKYFIYIYIYFSSSINIIMLMTNSNNIQYRHHLGGFPYLLDPTITTDGPTNGELDKSSFINLSANKNKIWILIESTIDTLWFQKYQLENESIIEDNVRF